MDTRTHEAVHAAHVATKRAQYGVMVPLSHNIIRAILNRALSAQNLAARELEAAHG